MTPRTRTCLVVLGAWSLWGLFNASRLRLVADLDWPTALRYGLPDALIWAAITPIPIWLVRRFPVTNTRHWRRLGVHLVAALLIAVAHSAIDAKLGEILDGRPFDSASWMPIFAKILRYTFHQNLMLYGVIVGITAYLIHQRKVRERSRREVELRAQLSEARLDALRMQLRPHFLFNVLHTISGMMGADAAAGRKVVSQLGELLRLSLIVDDQNEIPLEQELRFVRLYLELEQARFRDRLVVDIDAERGTTECAVPVLILQPLVENAVLHGIDRLTQGGRVQVRARKVGERLELVVQDNGPGLDDSPRRDGPGGLGLANTRARLRELYGDDQELTLEEVTDGGVRAVVSIPHRRV